MDYKKLLRNTKDKNKLSVTLKNSENKGVGLYATKTIKKGEVISYYRVKVFKGKDYDSPTDFVYLIEVYRKNGQAYKTLIGDVCDESFPQPINNITFWAPFANEPAKNERVNSELDIDLQTNYLNKTCTKAGEFMDYKLIATKIIRKGDEILWYYGEGYKRDYSVGKV